MDGWMDGWMYGCMKCMMGIRETPNDNNRGGCRGHVAGQT